MEKDIRYLIVLGFFVLSGVFTGWWLGSHPRELAPSYPGTPPIGGVGSTGPHQSQVVSNTTCSSPAAHIATPYQTVTRTNPMFCWDVMTDTNVSNWSFTLFQSNKTTPINGCTTGSNPVPTTTTSIVCQTSLNMGTYYWGNLHYTETSGVQGDDGHWYVAQ
jgi:hypothetical protein